jgi:hypothetical protein
MREPVTEAEKKCIEKYESFIKEIIDEYNPISVMDGASDDHYKKEIRDITLRLPRAKSCADVVEIMYVVFSYWFGMGEGGSREKLRDPAAKIAQKIGLWKRV